MSGPSVGAPRWRRFVDRAFNGGRSQPTRVRGTRMAEDEEEFEEEFEEEVAREEAQELSAEGKSIANKLKSKTGDGRQLAPWLNIDPEEIARQQKMKAQIQARQTAAASRVDAMTIDPQAAELSGTGGLKSKVLSEEEVELRWSTQGEKGNAGFIVQRRQGGTSAFTNIATFEEAAQLRTKGPQGGDYVYLDDTVAPGTYVYRIVDCDKDGKKNAISQKLVEVESEDEATFQFIVGGVIAVLALGLVVAGVVVDPIQTTDKGSSFF